MIIKMIENRFAKLLGEKKLDRRDIVKLTGLDSHVVLKIYKLCFALECDTNDIFKYIPD